MKLTLKTNEDLEFCKLNNVNYLYIDKKDGVVPEYCIKASLDNFEEIQEVNDTKTIDELLAVRDLTEYEYFFDKNYMPERFNFTTLINLMNVKDMHFDTKKTKLKTEKHSLNIEFKNGEKIASPYVKNATKYLKLFERFVKLNKNDKNEDLTK